MASAKIAIEEYRRGGIYIQKKKNRKGDYKAPLVTPDVGVNNKNEEPRTRTKKYRQEMQ